MRRAVVALAVAAVTAGGCTGEPEAAAAPESGSVQQPSDAETRGPVVSRGVPAQVSVEVDGAVSLTWTKEIDDLRIVTSFDVPDPSLRFLSVGLLDFVPLGDGHLFRTAFDLVGTGYVGDAGVFEIPVTVPASEATDARSIVAAMSNTFLLLIELEDPAAEATRDNVRNVRDFRTALEPCTVEVEAGERSGELDCPALADADGQTIHLHLSWQLTT